MRLHLYHDETPPDPDVCPICGAPLNSQGICPDWWEHYEDRYGPDWDDE